MQKILLPMFLLLGVILPSLGGVSIFLLMDIVNDAADAIAAEFPQVKVRTLAYCIMLPTPKNIVPRKNMMIEVATGPVAPSQPYPMPILDIIQIYPLSQTVILKFERRFS